jgi:acetyltransferase-like isoleucine patch superfamily enzyme
VVDQITIGAGSVIGAGSIVTRDIPAGVIAYGNPAKVVREVQVL